MLSGLALTVLTLAAPAGAACITGIPLEQLEPEYGLILEGTVTYIPGEIVLKTEQMAHGPVVWKGLRVWFKVTGVWKGKPGTDIEIVYTHHAQDMHGRFNEGQPFIVWAYTREGRWQTDDCAPTTERALATPEMLAFLERLKK